MFARPCKALLGIALAFIAPSAQALEGGYSNYQPGASGDFFVAEAPDPGFSVSNELYFYDVSSNERDDFGRYDSESQFLQNTLTLAYSPRRKILGARYEVSASVALAHSLDRLEFPGEPAESDHRTVLGDFYAVPLSLYWRVGRFHINTYQGISIPAGSWSAERLANASTNYWSLDSKTAVSWIHHRLGTEVSMVVGHTYNDRNSDTHYRSGQELNLDLMLNQMVGDDFAVGAHAFNQRQITDDHASDNQPTSRHAEVSGAGPALAWFFEQDQHQASLVLRWLHEFDARARPTGENFYVTFFYDL